MCLAIAPRVAADLPIYAAEKIDRALASAAPEMIAEIEALGKFRLRRCEHWREHLQQIEHVLKSSRCLLFGAT